jgi:predicted unusual protein kinase regulating ubiquinone biosynthesis (AarF/ABC1/UbiB family)
MQALTSHVVVYNFAIMLRSRYRRIVLFFARILLSFVLWDLLLPRVGMRGPARRTRPDRLRRSAVAFRSLAIQMGGVLIKVGQFLSSRVDVLPPEFTQELAGLQDEVPAESFADIRKVAEAEFGVPLENKFAAFEASPLAAASLGQVHRARLHKPPQPSETEQGSSSSAAGLSVDVVVKVQRPDIEKIIKTDLAALRTVGAWLQRYPPIRRRANVPLLLEEFSRILYEEIDYLAEGRNAETFAVNFKGHSNVRVPRVVWTHTTRRALTLENVWAIKITDYQAISNAGISRSEVASLLLDTYLKQIFEDGFFHADPHPGNLFVNPLHRPSKAGDSARTWELTFVDFGMVGQVPDQLRAGLREALIGVGTQDAARVVGSYEQMGLLLPHADLSLLERAVAREFEIFWGKNMTELSNLSFEEMRQFADEFQDLIYEMPFQIPQNLVFLARCVGILSGMCTGLDPEFNLWDHLAPFARKLMAEEGLTSLDAWLAEAEKLVRSLLIVPSKMESVLLRLERGDVAVRTPDVAQEVRQLETAIRQVTGSVIFAALLLGGIQLYLGGMQVFGAILLTMAGLDLLWVLLGGRRRGR